MLLPAVMPMLGILSELRFLAKRLVRAVSSLFNFASRHRRALRDMKLLMQKTLVGWIAVNRH